MLKLIKFISPYKKGAIAMMICSFLQVLGTLYIPTLTADIVNNGIVTGDLDNVMKTGGWMLLVAIVTACISIGGTYLSIAISTAVGKDIRNTMFRKSQSFSKNDMDKFGTASLITRATSDVEQVQRSFYTIIEMLLPLPVMA
ncbi:MAG TPA: ABC transporter ATP-binding protein, partial [Candidatus Pelethocola excrementipullorum]|nr:ABC transporter ATP-binding protein [Candidatus Pelethocola excrementipullorum]